MLFTVETGFAGSIELELEADTVREAVEKANQVIAEMDETEILNQLDLQRTNQTAVPHAVVAPADK